MNLRESALNSNRKTGVKMEILKQIAAALLAGDDERVPDLAGQALQQGLTPARILNEGLIAGMEEVGRQFKCHDIFLPDVLLAARAMTAGLEVLKPSLIRDGVPSRGKVILGTVQGDLHDIGKNLVGILLRGAGFEVIDLGHDVAPEAFAEAAEREGAAVVGMSALLTTTMPAMGQTVAELRARGLAGRVRTIVGGAPVSEAFAREIGADAYAFDGTSAVERVAALVPSA
jgi:5-methyltetrahydrofolate--homocysteine methyltransferase